MKKEFSPLFILVILLTMPIQFLVGFALVLRGKTPWINKKSKKKFTQEVEKRPSYKRASHQNVNSYYG